jgi:hypothetical protein
VVAINTRTKCQYQISYIWITQLWNLILSYVPWGWIMNSHLSFMYLSARNNWQGRKNSYTILFISFFPSFISLWYLSFSISFSSFLHLPFSLSLFTLSLYPFLSSIFASSFFRSNFLYLSLRLYLSSSILITWASAGFTWTRGPIC